MNVASHDVSREEKVILADVAPGNDSAIIVGSIYKSYSDKTGVIHALNGVDLEVQRGAIHGVIGASGAGKTTLLRCIARLEKPDAGAIIVESQHWATLPEQLLYRERHKMGIVFQHLHLLSSRTVAANVALPLEVSGVSRPEIWARVHELLHWFGIREKADEYPSRLSGGQRQRVALARALATKPVVLLADEPTSALDTETKESVLAVLRRIRNELGVTILLITHDLYAASSVCDVVSVLDAGRIVETGPVGQMFKHPVSAAARRLLTPQALAGYCEL
jgi:D-methionine transport system ATP-binding protein